ncbi:ADP-ribose-binding protein [Vulcanisaeta souniana]|uniref:O-acetyl-ADP-ribose deacetylase n=1 Tax=Vulcanisaeta souniana JCM 11219 TaxID=1293586 RepID=A0A830EKW9_9CREN|nr:ADP-ribose-binding protein [Vulcanisaeta souniana]BDR92840.1 O-acetyl-ADP-ribose deacetylase [Vulcanisaeta souniana JCM 11219]GGI81763.1 O-acetyl-ADP-ribose deacetylase [Vulcanisaeta souniana JCM 11219]
MPLFKFPNEVTVELIKGDITEVEADAIVNAANSYLEHGGGVAGAIVRRGGWVIQEESREWVRKHGPVPVGGVAVTSAGKLKAKYVIHTVGPRCGIEPIEKLDDAVTNSLKKAEELGLTSIAFPAISTGIFGCPYEDAARIMARVIKREAPGLRNIRRIIICLYGDEAFNVFSKVLSDELKEYKSS